MTDQVTVLDAMVILEREDGRILLIERANTGYADGMLNLPSGKVERGESVEEAAVREAFEEVGVKIDPADLHPVHVVHHRNPEGNARIGWFFATTRWEGRPHNAEPTKCAGLTWANPDHLPENTVPYNAHGIAAYRRGTPLSLHGWS
ncbi:NUDIX domain-containing protein [Kitasatospora sp. NPDC096140]|uniref:NUDIX hydrolase n=1 Tax=Kitasatospora sp. NPDC096140 TaxID=3155425 RepID=UPI003321AF00